MILFANLKRDVDCGDGDDGTGACLSYCPAYWYRLFVDTLSRYFACWLVKMGLKI